MARAHLLAEDNYAEDDTCMMYSYKVVPCFKRYRHDWRKCPYAHATEKARRRDPLAFKYLSVFCPEERQGLECPRGDSCPLAHNVFEFWLHPARYKTVLCKEGMACKRAVCFFAHKATELRVPQSLGAPEVVEGSGGDLSLQIALLQALLETNELSCSSAASSPMAGAASRGVQLQLSSPDQRSVLSTEPSEEQDIGYPSLSLELLNTTCRGVCPAPAPAQQLPSPTYLMPSHLHKPQPVSNLQLLPSLFWQLSTN